MSMGACMCEGYCAYSLPVVRFPSVPPFFWVQPQIVLEKMTKLWCRFFEAFITIDDLLFKYTADFLTIQN